MLNIKQLVNFNIVRQEVSTQKLKRQKLAEQNYSAME